MMNCDLINCITIFDFDDTLFPRSSVVKNKFPTETQWKELNQIVLTILKISLGIGPVAILTNATAEYVLNSIKTYIPAILTLIDPCTKQSVKIYSARDNSQIKRQMKSEMKGQLRGKIKAGSYSDLIGWKKQTLEKILNSWTSSQPIIISVGDSEVDRQAVLQCPLAKKIKTIKLNADDNCHHLICQLKKLISDSFLLTDLTTGHYEIKYKQLPIISVA